MNSKPYKFKAKVWLYPGEAGWHFVNVPKNLSKQIDKSFAHLKRGFGSLPVVAQIGKTFWKTSIFPDTKSGTYLLALKVAVRKAEHIKLHDRLAIVLQIREL